MQLRNSFPDVAFFKLKIQLHTRHQVRQVVDIPASKYSKQRAQLKILLHQETCAGQETKLKCQIVIVPNSYISRLVKARINIQISAIYINTMRKFTILESKAPIRKLESINN